MKIRTAQKIVMILLVGSIFIISISSLSKLFFSKSDDKANEPQQVLKIQEGANKQELPLKEQVALDVPVNSAGYKQWAAESSVPVVYNPDLESLIGRERNNKALEGITVFLLLPTDGSMPLPKPSEKNENAGTKQTKDSFNVTDKPLIGIPLNNTNPWQWNLVKDLAEYNNSINDAQADAGAKDKDEQKGGTSDKEATQNQTSEAADQQMAGGETNAQSAESQDATKDGDENGDRTEAAANQNRRVERVIDEKTGETSMDPTATKAGEVTISEISVSTNVVNSTKERLESLGAKVVVVGGMQQAMTEQQKAAFVGNHILQHFIENLRKVSFSSERVNDLRQLLVKAEAYNISATELAKLFPEQGVSQDLRLLLDIERQYTDSVCVDFSVLDSNIEERGTSIQWLGNVADNGAKTVVENDFNNQPVYVNYADHDRLLLANKAANNIGGLLPDMKTDPMVKQFASKISRYINLNMIEVKLGRLTNPIDGKILASTDNCGVISEAIANSIFEYFNQVKN